MFDSYANKLVKQHRELMDRILVDKLKRLIHESLVHYELELYKVLSGLDLNNPQASTLEMAMVKLNNKGYNLIVEYPQVKYTNESNNVFKATLEVDKIKLKVQKVIFEI